MPRVGEHTGGRLPHTNQQLTRGSIGFLVGGVLAILTGLLVYLLDAPTWVDVVLGVVTLVSLAVAVVAPAWFWVVQPYFRNAEEP